MFNLTVLQGRICQDLELKQTQNGTMVTSFSIAVDRAYKKGEEKQTDFIPVVVWGKQAEIVTKYFKKGNRIGIEGRIQVRKYTDSNGNNRTAFEVVANNIHFVDSKSDNNTESNTGYVSAPEYEELPNDQDLPF